MLECFGCDDGIVQVFAFFLVFSGMLVSAVEQDIVLSPGVVEFGEVFEVALSIGGGGFLELLGFLVDLEGWIDFRYLAEELCELHGVGLQDFQALPHLWRQGLLLAQVLAESVLNSCGWHGG